MKIDEKYAQAVKDEALRVANLEDSLAEAKRSGAEAEAEAISALLAEEPKLAHNKATSMAKATPTVIEAANLSTDIEAQLRVAKVELDYRRNLLSLHKARIYARDPNVVVVDDDEKPGLFARLWRPGA